MAEVVSGTHVLGFEVGLDFPVRQDYIAISKSAVQNQQKTHGRITLKSTGGVVLIPATEKNTAVYVATLPVSGEIQELPCFIEQKGTILVPLSDENLLTNLGTVVGYIQVSGEESGAEFRLTTLNFRTEIIE